MLGANIEHSEMRIPQANFIIIIFQIQLITICLFFEIIIIILTIVVTSSSIAVLYNVHIHLKLLNVNCTAFDKVENETLVIIYMIWSYIIINHSRLDDLNFGFRFKFDDNIVESFWRLYT